MFELSGVGPPAVSRTIYVTIFNGLQQPKIENLTPAIFHCLLHVE